MPPLAQKFWVLKPSVVAHGQQPFTIVQSSLPPVEPNAQVVAGPFNTRAEAQAWINKQTAGPPVPNISIPNPFAFLAWIQEIGHWIGVAVAYVTDGPMWRSIGWIALGFVMALAGILLWLGKISGIKPSTVVSVARDAAVA